FPKEGCDTPFGKPKSHCGREEKDRRPPGHPGTDGAEDARRARPAARVRSCQAHRADQRRSADAQHRHALSAPPAARAGRGDCVRTRAFRKQSKRTVLPADRRRPQTAAIGDPRLGADGLAHRAVLRGEGGGSGMRRLRRFLIRLTASVTRRRDDERLRQDLEDHIALQTDANVRAGMSAGEARRQAVLALGPVAAIREDCHDEQRLPSLEHLLQDVRMALRRMRQAPGFSVAAVATLALGLGLNSAVLGLAYALFLKPLPVDDPSRVVIVNRVIAGDSRRGFPISFPEYVYYRNHARTFADLAAHYSTSPMSIVTPGGPLNGMGAVVTANYFRLLRLQPAVGRFFLPDEDVVPGRNPVVVLSYDLWRTRFGADGAILGTAVRINGIAFTVVGIAPEGFHGVLIGLPPNDVWIPSAMFGVGYRYCDGLAQGCNVIDLLGRLDDAVSVQDAQAEMNVLTSQLQSVIPKTDSRVRSVEVRPARGIRLMEQQRDSPIVQLLAGAAALVLIVTSANVAGLMLARGLRRRREIAIRLALGASRGRVIRLLLVESVTLAVVGGAAGLLVSAVATGVLRGYFGQAGGPDTLDL